MNPKQEHEQYDTQLHKHIIIVDNLLILPWELATKSGWHATYTLSEYDARDL